MNIKKDTSVVDAIKASKKAVKVFEKYGLDCPGCKGASEDTIEKVAVNNGLDVGDLLRELNESEGK